MTNGRRRSGNSFIRNHSLGMSVGGILLLWLVLYIRADPSTHIGAFYGNAVADWLGTFMIVIATKYFYEIGSKESLPPHLRGRSAFRHFVECHSLTIVLVVTGVGWAIAYARMDANGKVGQVVGNVVSEWTQLIGLVVMTKYAHEIGSKEG